MSWLQKLYATYEACVTQPDFIDPPQREGHEVPALMPVSHVSQQAQILVALDGEGNFLSAELLPPKTSFVIPATEDSAARTSGPVPHPLADKIHYCAKDYAGTKENLYHLFGPQLKAWCDSSHSHPKIRAVYAYLERGALVRDLVNYGVLHADASGTLLTQAPEGLKDSIFSRLVAKKVDGATIRDQGEALVVWSVVLPGDLESRTWKDKSVQDAWMAYDAARMEQKGLCLIQGTEASITTKHPRNIRRPGDGAKLISSNDGSGFTFRGRFLTAEESCTVGYEASHKAHNALRWLLARQGYHSRDGQAVVAWAANGASIPGPCEVFLPDEDWVFDPEEGTDLEIGNVAEAAEESIPLHADVGEAFSRRLSKAIRGYKAELSDAEGISILALDAAGPGRLAVTYYSEQTAVDYLDHLEQWQKDFGWVLPVRLRRAEGEKDHTVYLPCAPTPENVARVAYGRRVDDKLFKATVERLLPCIVDERPLPRDLMECCVRRACNRPGLEKGEWSEVLSVACALYRGFYARHPKETERRVYSMSLDETCRSRDYLYGRLLAVAEYAERRALDAAGESRPTNAERLMQRFADQPCPTWLQIWPKLQASYLNRLQNKDDKFVRWVKRLVEQISAMFEPAEFTSPKRLSGEFLLGYHCQRQAFYQKSTLTASTASTIVADEKGEDA